MFFIYIGIRIGCWMLAQGLGKRIGIEKRGPFHVNKSKRTQNQVLKAITLYNEADERQSPLSRSLATQRIIIGRLTT